jgi:excisionase family DNA binding protein
MIQPRLLTVKDAATYLGRTEKAVRHLVATHSLPCVRTDARIMLDRQDLDRWIDNNKTFTLPS